MNRALQKASSDEIRLAKLKRKHESVVRDGKKYAGPSRTWPGQGATVSFSVLMQEPMTKDEAEMVKAGIEIDTWPAVKRWAKRSKLNDLSKVLYVEPSQTGQHTAADIAALAKCTGNCQRKFRKQK